MSSLFSLEDPIKLVIANSYGEDDKFARHTFYANQTQVNSMPTRKLSCHIVLICLLRQRTII